jgi:hypothetical protein
MQKLTLRFAVVSFIYYGFAVIEGMIMRMVLVEPTTMIPFVPEGQYYVMLTVHPWVGFFGASYTVVFGAFYFALLFLMKNPLWNPKLANGSFWLITTGVFTFWFVVFFHITLPFILSTGFFQLIFRHLVHRDICF